MFDYQALAKKRRFEGLPGILAVFAGVFVTVASVTVVTAQTAFEFEDPLDDLREKLGMPATDGAGAAEQVAAVGADGAGAMSSLSLFAIAAAILLALIVGLVWWLGRKRRARRLARDSDNEVYVTDEYSPPRRVLESGSAVTRERSARLDTREDSAPSKPAFGAAAPTAAATAAMILNDEADDTAAEAAAAKASKSAEKKPTSASRNDPGNWQQPNLDRLKESIREDWPTKATAATAATGAMAATAAQTASAAADKVSETRDAAATVAADTKNAAAEKVSDTRDALASKVDDFRSDDDTFDSMFGDDAGFVEHPRSPETSFAGQIEDIAANDATLDLKQGDSPEFEGSASHIPSRNDALKRIKALRESVKAG